ncbi:MAG: hypothetical protein ACJ788_01630 [Ktedonobacteraceae bacterium]
MVSFTNPTIEYVTTVDNCNCPDRSIRHAKEANYICKHMACERQALRAEAGRPRNIEEARAARIERNRQTAAAYYRMEYMSYGEF